MGQGFRDVLTPERILEAYAAGFFPMGEPGSGAIHWYHPDPRTILPLDGLKVSQGARRKIKAGAYEVRFDTAFAAVLEACAQRPPTWITPEVARAYTALHERGRAHSAEAWSGAELVGGVYGVRVGAAFMAESMFHSADDAGMVALHGLVEKLRRNGFALLDVQFMTGHLGRSGAVEIPRQEYLDRLAAAVRTRTTWD